MIGSIKKCNGCIKLLFVIVALLAVILLSHDTIHAASHSQKYWMKKTLKAYEEGNYKAAKKYNKKMKKTAKEKCVKKMSKKQKQKYRAVIKKWPLEQQSYDDAYLWDYYLTDYNNNGKADLILLTGTCEADAVYRIYTYKKGKVKKLGKFAGGHSVLSAYPGNKGVVLSTAHMGYESISHVYRKKKKNVVKNINTRETDNYLVLRNKLKSHVKYDDSGKHLKLGDLK